MGWPCKEKRRRFDAKNNIGESTTRKAATRTTQAKVAGPGAKRHKKTKSRGGLDGGQGQMETRCWRGQKPTEV